MALTPSSRIGPYEIVAPIGAGGMGEVYRARDTKLNRDVAIKVLPPALAQDGVRMARFHREAQALAALNHPNIAQIYGMEGAALVLEYVPGEELRGPLPVEEAIQLARQIAEALEAAHEKGIIHRDLKPANIKLTPEGQVKVLDFGLAKAMEDAPAAADMGNNSPTLSLAATKMGVILGTAAYMSPEQAKGKGADRRADIWSFGVVLLELLTGKRAFPGDNASEVMAGVILKEPTIPAGLPAPIEKLLHRCLTKDPRQRLQAIGEARIMLEEQWGGPPGPPSAVTTRRRLLPWAVIAGSFGVMAVVAFFVASWALSWAPRKTEPIRRVNIELGADASPSLLLGPAAILSPDGALLAFAAAKSPQDKTMLYLRRLDQLKATPLPGTEGAESPFFSPDGQWIAFFADRRLKKISINGGVVFTLCDAGIERGGTWSEDGTIFFTNFNTGLMRVPAAGGSPESFTPARSFGGSSHRWPQALPGGKAVLFTAGTPGNFDTASLVVRQVATDGVKVVHKGGYYGRYLPSNIQSGAVCRECGHLAFIHQGILFAAPFDLGRLEMTGQPTPILEDVVSYARSAGAQFAFSEDGTLVYLPGGQSGHDPSIFWLDRSGKVEPFRSEPAGYSDIHFSPDGRSLAVVVSEAQGRNLWICQWERKNISRFTFEAGDVGNATWTPDGRRIAYYWAATGTGTPNIYWRQADGGEPQRLTNSPNAQLPQAWHPSGKSLVYSETSPQGTTNLMVLPMEGSEDSGWKPGKPYRFSEDPVIYNVGAAFSPDGRWLAYGAIESGSGKIEIYVRPFPGPGGKWLVSTDGGILPTWSRTAKELFYLTLENRIMVVGYSAAGASFQADQPRLWSDVLSGAYFPPGRSFDLHPDGKRIAVLKPAGLQAETKLDHVVLVLNFFEELRRLAQSKPVGR